MVKFIASDIDGTLLPHGTKQLKPEIFDIIMELKGKGIRFAAASGRQYHGLQALFEPIKDEISYIAENGSLCVHDGQILSKGLIERDLGLRIFSKVQEFKKCKCMLSCESKIFTAEKDNKFIEALEKDLRYKINVVNDLSEVQEEFLKIAIFSDEGTEDMEAYFSEYFKDEIKVVTSGNFWVDFIAPNANKAIGLESLLKHFNIDPEHCVAFGDQYNDVEMLQYAGTSYAMSHSAPGISYFANHVTASVEDVLNDILSNAVLFDE